METFKILILLSLTINLSAQRPPKNLIHVEKAGTLLELISEEKMYQITQLTLTGELNSTDIALLRQMAGGGTYEKRWKNNKVSSNKNDMGVLKSLNIENVIFVDDDGAYFEQESDRKYVYLSKKLAKAAYGTKKGEISDLMFYGCNKLQEIILPNNITVIGDEAFSASGITRIIIPQGVVKIGKKAFPASLTTIKIDNSNPPEIDTNTFINVNKKSCKLLVPAGAKNDYMTEWGFENVTEQKEKKSNQ